MYCHCFDYKCRLKKIFTFKIYLIISKYLKLNNCHKKENNSKQNV